MDALGGLAQRRHQCVFADPQRQIEAVPRHAAGPGQATAPCSEPLGPDACSFEQELVGFGADVGMLDAVRMQHRATAKRRWLPAVLEQEVTEKGSVGSQPVRACIAREQPWHLVAETRHAGWVPSARSRHRLQLSIRHCTPRRPTSVPELLQQALPH
jgi:hypothetical protein